MSAGSESRSLSGRCDLCGNDTGPFTDASLLDISGGSYIQLCDACRDALETTRCRVCGQPQDGGAGRVGDLAFHSDMMNFLPVCGDCRRGILFKGERVMPT